MKKRTDKHPMTISVLIIDIIFIDSCRSLNLFHQSFFMILWFIIAFDNIFETSRSIIAFLNIGKYSAIYDE